MLDSEDNSCDGQWILVDCLRGYGYGSLLKSHHTENKVFLVYFSNEAGKRYFVMDSKIKNILKGPNGKYSILIYVLQSNTISP